MNTMIYLFNSAYKPDYLQNVYRLIGMPSGSRQEMRYTEAQNTPAAGSDVQFENTDCVICYVDRFARDGYQFFPIRKGQIKQITRAHGRVYYEIELGDHCYTENPGDFTRRFYQSVKNCPKLTDGDPKSANDGPYCTDGPSFEEHLICNALSWSKAVDQILTTECFQDDAPPFFLTEISRGEKGVKSNKYGLRFRANRNYRITIYSKTKNATKGGKRLICVRIGTDIYREFLVGSNDNREHFDFCPLPIDFATSAISIRTSIDANGPSGGETEYSLDIPFRTESWVLSLTLLTVLFLFSFINQARLPETDILSWRTAFIAFLEFIPFAIIVFTIHAFRGRLKLPGLG